jgi:hypothetical protein
MKIRSFAFLLAACGLVALGSACSDGGNTGGGGAGAASSSGGSGTGNGGSGTCGETGDVCADDTECCDGFVCSTQNQCE